MEYVKICGLKQYENIQLCMNNGADAVGFIYNVPSSPRNMQKNEIKGLLTKINNEIATVIVGKPLNVVELKENMNEFNVTYFQIHPDFPIQELDALDLESRKKIILAFKVNQANKKEIIKRIRQIHDKFFAILIDNSEGHGNELDLKLVEDILKEIPKVRLIIAGGININNVETIIKVLKPFGIDVSSSLESEKGVKNPSKIKNFLDKVKEIKKNKRE